MSLRIARVVAVLITAVSVFLVSRVQLSRDLTELFPKTPEAELLARTTRAFGGSDVALVLLRGDDPAEVDRAAHQAAEALRSCGSVASVIDGPPPLARRGDELPDPTGAWRWAGPVARAKLAEALTEQGMRARLRDTRALLLAPGFAGDVADAIARDPLRLSMIPWEGQIEIAAGARGARVDGDGDATAGADVARARGAFAARGGRDRLLVVAPRGRVFVSEDARLFTTEAEAALERVRLSLPHARQNAGVTIALTGGHVVAKETEAMMRSDLQKSGALSVVLASLVFVLTFRRGRALVAVLPPLAAGTLWTTALAVLVYPRLSAIATAFAAVVIGVGVDTGVHVYGRLLAARRAGHTPFEAARIARRETWKATLGAAFAAGGAFACLALSEIAGMRQLGVLCGIGEVATALAIVLFVPEIGAWLERGPPPPLVRLPFAATLTRTRLRALAALSLALAAVAVALALGLPGLDHGVVALDPKTLPALATYEAIDTAFGGTRSQLLVVSADPDPDRARARADAVAEAAELLAQRGTIAGFDALAPVAPSLALQRVRLAERDLLDLPGASARLARILVEQGFAVDAFAPARDAFLHPTNAVSDVASAPSSGADVLAWITSRHLGQDEHGALALTFVRPTGHAADDAEARATLRAADPEAVFTGLAELERSLKGALARDLPRVLAGAFGMVLVVLALTLRRVSSVVLAVAVLVVEIAIVLVVARVFGARWHVYDALVLPVLLGITLDEAMFLLHAEQTSGSIDHALAEQAPLATATALTTAAGFAALGICRFRGLVDVGTIGALGSIVGLVCALVVIPAGLRVVLKLRSVPRDAADPD